MLPHIRSPTDAFVFYSIPAREEEQMTTEEMAVKITEVEARSKSNTKRIDTMEERQDSFDKLVTSVEVLATKQEAVETDVKEIKSDVKALAEKPAKRWDGLVDKVVWALLAALIGFVLGHIGIG